MGEEVDNMNIKKIILYGLGGVALYLGATALFNLPASGAFLLLPLALCGAMHLFMNHGDEKKHAAHKH